MNHRHGHNRRPDAGEDFRGAGRGGDFGFGRGMGFGPPWARGGRGPGGPRMRRGDIRIALLSALTDGPAHGYELIQRLEQRTEGRWRPSPGSVYPTLQLLADEGLVTSTDGSGSKRLFELTDEGRTAAEALDAPPWEEMAQDLDPDDVSLRTAIGQLMGAAFQVHHAATGTQKTRAIAAINEARREIYAILGEIDEPSGESEED